MTERPATPWWVKAIGTAVVVALVIAALIFVISGGRHGPGIHGPSGADLQGLTTTAHAAAGAVGVGS